IRSILSIGKFRFCSLLIENDRYATIPRMLAVERRRLIAESVRSRGVVSVAEMAEALGTTEITLRRDLRVMATEVFLVRATGCAGVDGGAAGGSDPDWRRAAPVDSRVGRPRRRRVGARAAGVADIHLRKRFLS